MVLNRKIGIAACVVLASVGFAESVMSAPRGPRGERGEARNVEGAMKGMGRALKELKKNVAESAQKDANLKLVSDMQRNCVLAKDMAVPDDVLKKMADDGARDKAKVAYRADLIKVMRTLLDLEQSILDGKADVAKSQIDDVLKQREAGHKDLGVKEEKRRGRRGE